MGISEDGNPIDVSIPRLYPQNVYQNTLPYSMQIGVRGSGHTILLCYGSDKSYSRANPNFQDS